VTLEKKHIDEDKAIQHILEGISFGDRVYDLWSEFEKQDTQEAKFVHALDKIEGYLQLDERGTDTYIHDVFHADYATEAVQKFDEATQSFPVLGPLLDLVKQELKEKFEKRGVDWVEA